MSLNGLTEEERVQALARYQILRPYLDGQTTLKEVIETRPYP